MPPKIDHGVRAVSTYVEDPFRTGYIEFSRDSAFSLAKGSIEIATVVDVIPHARCYRLQSAIRPNARGVLLSDTSYNTASGVNSMSCLQINSMVLVYYPYKENSRGFILGAIPPFVWDNNLVVPPVLVPGSDVGITEPLFQHMLKGEDFNGQGKGVENFAGGAPADNLPGDWGTISEYGVGVLVSKMLATMRAGDNCSVMVSYLDQLLRLHGYNYEMFTSASEHRIFNDEQEVHDVHFRCKFPWEALGLGEHGTNAFSKESGEWKADDRKAYYEPMYEDQTGLWRDIELRGYLGDLYRSMVVAPGDSYASNPITYTDAGRETNYAGLSEITRSANGSVGIRSAKEIILSKYSLIPVPQQKTLPDDNTEGDWRQNYKASNEVGSGASADEMKDFKWTPEDEADMKPALLLDYMAWVFNFHKWENILAHKKDWRIGEEDDTVDKWQISRAYIEGGKITPLDGAYWADIPKSVDIDIDSRVKGQKYYESMSAFAMLDDGSVVLEDGWGSSIVLSRGNIQICCAGDVFMRPGRSFYAFAPKDAMLRAGGSIDLTATTKDIRVKAEKNLQMLAGNDSQGSGEGGILLESRSAGMHMDFSVAGESVRSGGIVLRCKRSAIVGWANEIYMGTKKFDESSAGRIMFSADEGEADMIFQGDKMMRHIKSMAIDRFDAERANIFMKSVSILDTKQLIMRGTGYFTNNGNLYCEGNIGAGSSIISEGSIAAGGSVTYGGKTPTLLPGNDGATKNRIKPPLKAADIGAQAIETTAIPLVEQAANDFQDGSDKIGANDLAIRSTFSLRTESDYDVPDFKIFAARWQQLLKEIGGGKTWKERSVRAGSDTTYPFPGRSKYEGGSAYYSEVPMKYFKLSTGRATARGEDGGIYKDRANEDQGSAQSLNEYTATVSVA